MLQKMHEHLKGWVAVILIAVVAVSFMAWGVQYYLSGGASSGAAVVVNGTAISEKQIQDTVHSFQRQAVANGVALTDAVNQQ